MFLYSVPLYSKFLSHIVFGNSLKTALTLFTVATNPPPHFVQTVQTQMQATYINSFRNFHGIWSRHERPCSYQIESGLGTFGNALVLRN